MVSRDFWVIRIVTRGPPFIIHNNNMFSIIKDTKLGGRVNDE